MSGGSRAGMTGFDAQLGQTFPLYFSFCSTYKIFNDLLNTYCTGYGFAQVPTFLKFLSVSLHPNVNNNNNCHSDIIRAL